MGTIRTFGDVEAIVRRLDLSLEQARTVIGRFAQIGVTPGRLLGLLERNPANARIDSATQGKRLAQLADYLGFVIRLPGATPDRLREGFEELMAHPGADLARLGHLMLYFGVLVQQPRADARALLGEFTGTPTARAPVGARAGRRPMASAYGY